MKDVKSSFKNRLSGVLIILVSALIMIQYATAVEKGTPTEQLKSTLDKLVNSFNDPALKTPENVEKRREILLNVIRERFDEETFSEKVLGKKYWNQRTPGEKKKFISLFSNLLVRSYFDKIDTYLKDAKGFSPDNIKYLKETIKGKYAVVATKVVVAPNNEVPIYYRLINRNGEWLICDMAIEGVSLVKNYRAQFRDIIANSSFDELLVKLKDKEIKASKDLAAKKEAR